MARRRSTRTAIVRVPTGRAPVIRVNVPRPIVVGRGGRRRGGRRRGGGSSFLGGINKNIVIGAAIWGFIQKSGVTLPTIIATLGTTGNAALIAYALHRWGRVKFAGDIATFLAALAAYQYAGTGSVSGDEDEGMAVTG